MIEDNQIDNQPLIELLKKVHEATEKRINKLKSVKPFIGTIKINKPQKYTVTGDWGMDD